MQLTDSSVQARTEYGPQLRFGSYTILACKSYCPQRHVLFVIYILVLYIYQIRITRKHIPFFQVQLLGTFVTHMIFLDFLFGTDVSQSFFYSNNNNNYNNNKIQ